jgi:hypothetical protein
MVASDPALPLLHRGCRGPAVRRLQEQLERVGANPGAIDADYGANTEAAVLRFQRRRPWLLADGVAGPRTGAELLDTALQQQGRATLAALAQGTLAPIPLEAIAAQPGLGRALAACLRAHGLHPGGLALSDPFNPDDQAALATLRRQQGLAATGPLAADDAAALLGGRPQAGSGVGHDPARLAAVLEAYQRRVRASDARLGVLDHGAGLSPFVESIAAADSLLEAHEAAVAGLPLSAPPALGRLPQPFDGAGLGFLPAEISEACVCLDGSGTGGSGAGPAWLGRRALDPLECLSSTKIVPLLQVLCRSGALVADEPAQLRVRHRGGDGASLGLERICLDVVSYASCVGSSNGLAAMLNQLEPQPEQWIRGITGQPRPIRFAGRYGEEPTIRVPELTTAAGRLLLPFARPAAAGNRLAVYDLTRLLALVGWHGRLSPEQRLAGLSAAGRRLAVRALATDPARYLDVALAALGLERDAAGSSERPVILSKLGYGESALVYAAFLLWRGRSLAFCLRVAKGPGDAEAVRADTAMAQGVTALLRRCLVS